MFASVQDMTPARFDLLHVLHEKRRLRLSRVAQCDLRRALGVTRQNLSNHLACLRGCGLVVAVQEGRRARYELADARLGHAIGTLLGVVLAADPTACPSSDVDDCC